MTKVTTSWGKKWHLQKVKLMELKNASSSSFNFSVKLVNKPFLRRKNFATETSMEAMDVWPLTQKNYPWSKEFTSQYFHLSMRALSGKNVSMPSMPILENTTRRNSNFALKIYHYENINRRLIFTLRGTVLDMQRKDSH